MLEMGDQTNVSNQKLKRGILFFFLAMISLPILSLVFSVKIDTPVHRTTITTSVNPFSMQSWLDGSFQQSAQQFINDQIGFFPSFVRVHNQIQFSLFNRIYTGDIIAGKENYLFEERYIKAQAGENFVGINTIKRQAQKLKALQDSLKRMHKFLFVCLAANKPTYYQEYLPYAIKKDSSNREFFIQQFNKLQVDYLNFDSWFLEMKDSLGDLLYPKYGIHWSYYGEMLATDSISKYIAHKTGWPLPRLKIEEGNYSPIERFYDSDIANSMNLIQSPHHDSLMYPDFTWEQPNGKPANKKMLIIGDSFALIMVEELQLGGGCFEDLNFWYYNLVVREANQKKGQTFGAELPKLVRHLDFYKAFQEVDAIMIMTNEPSMPLFIKAVTKDLENVLADSTYRAGMYGDDKLKTQCKSTTMWTKELKAQAAKRQISFDEMIDIYLSDPNYNMEKERLLSTNKAGNTK